ncbi:hypothetical protein ES332_A06G180200v1 [Gossypium tomentosum]|uniref:Uncharacterized protein n=1 Tax=Gossypium tomentosum TaxID=34277 RepID=A0A5D2Q839_GOSTO|nr:hypothetical protein ES332_A06G180200v1 [Gossypium tomentosum]
MSLIIAPITDLSISVLWHFLITVLESPTTSILLKPIKIPNFTSCNPTCTSAVNGVAISKGVTFDAKISPFSFRTIKPETDLEYCWSKAASK